MNGEKRFYTEPEIQTALRLQVEGMEVAEIAKKLNRTPRSLQVTMDNYRHGTWKPRSRKYNKSNVIPFSPGTEVVVKKPQSMFFNQVGTVDSLGNNANIRNVKISGQPKSFPYALSDIEARCD
ncbi:hypothetical protein K2X83_00715 [Patescibacteria group bacterium]|nr:hypothetical protein [Patescibacteria group bacterium]